MKFHVFLVGILCCSCGPKIGPVVPKTPVQHQMLALLEKFDRWDYNGDGQLGKTELAHGIASLHGKPQEVSYTTKEVLDFYDTDRNGKISLAEAQKGYSRSHEVGKVPGA